MEQRFMYINTLEEAKYNGVVGCCNQLSDRSLLAGTGTTGRRSSWSSGDQTAGSTPCRIS